MSERYKEWGLSMQAMRVGHERTAEGEHSEPIFATSSFVFANAAEAAARFAGDQPGNIYSRFTNPTVRIFEERLAVMEGGEACVATASGMSAVMAVCMGLLSAGDHVICSRSVFGSTLTLFEKYLTRFGIGVSFVGLTDVSAWRDAIRSNKYQNVVYGDALESADRGRRYTRPRSLSENRLIYCGRP